MEKKIRELRKIGDDLQAERDRLAREIREGGKQSQDGFERVMRAVHRMHTFLFDLPEKLMRIAEDLKK